MSVEKRRERYSYELADLRRRRGLSLIEVLVATTVFILAMVPLGKLVTDSGKAFTTLAGRSQIAARGQVIMDRILDEVVSGRFMTLSPPIPNNSSWIRFQRIVGFASGAPVFGRPLQIELTPNPSDPPDGMDNDGDGLVDEGNIRIWEDRMPYGITPGSEDRPVILSRKVAPNGLSFTRVGAVLIVQVTLQAITEPGQPPTLVSLAAGARMRND